MPGLTSQEETATTAPERPGRRRAGRIGLAIGLVVLLATSFGIARHVAGRRPDAVRGNDWRDGCAAVGAADFAALLDPAPAIRVSGWDVASRLTGQGYSDTRVCSARTATAVIEVKVTTDGVTASPAPWLAPDGDTHGTPHDLPLGDGARSWSDRAAVHLTCHPDGTARAFGITVTTTGAARTTDASRRSRLNDLAEKFTAYVQRSDGCVHR